ncbi:MAG: LytTR family transcriptional regulator [Defluviitaleaceae bacterium]|nr:LytTR family transcriptional regulator [Defluviitaleaceae bacterium]
MRYIRKETVFINNRGDDSCTIIIPECMSRISKFGEKAEQTVTISANEGSIAITTNNLYGNTSIPGTNHFGTDYGMTILTTIINDNVLTMPHGLLNRASMVDSITVVLYLIDLSTIVVFPLETVSNESSCNAEQNLHVKRAHEVTSKIYRPKSSDGFFLVENRDEVLKIRLSDILYFEKVKGTHNTCVVFAGGMSTFKCDLQDVLNRLDGGFVQCHKAFIANMTRVKRIEKRQSTYILHFSNNHNCPCSVFHRKAVMDWKY